MAHLFEVLTVLEESIRAGAVMQQADRPTDRPTDRHTVEPDVHNNALNGAPPLKGKILKSQDNSGFCIIKIPLVFRSCFNSKPPLLGKLFGPFFKEMNSPVIKSTIPAA